MAALAKIAALSLSSYAWLLLQVADLAKVVRPVIFILLTAPKASVQRHLITFILIILLKLIISFWVFRVYKS